MGFEVQPTEVRLNPRPKDPYFWKILPGNEGLYASILSKNLSEHSIGTYRLLSSEVGKGFEAVARDPPNRPSAPVSVGTAWYVNGKPLDAMQLSSANENFTTIIQQLREENEYLFIQLNQTRDALHAKSQRAQFLEAENERLSSAQILLEEKVKDHSNAVRYYEDVARKCVAELDRSLPALEAIRTLVATRS